MKKYLLPEAGKFYKANLHTHTTVSDGKLTPEEAKERFMSLGYSVVAFTDHEVMVPHPELCDDNFIALTGIEISINEAVKKPFNKTYHLNVYSPELERSVTGTFCAGSVWGNAKLSVTDEMVAAGTATREYSREFVQKMIDTATEEGCLVSYNHPVWSLQSKDDYSGIKGFFGIEWSNTSACGLGDVDTYKPIRDLLAEGERMCYPLATDDCHQAFEYGGGWVDIKAPAFTYGDIFEALRRGDFYSSTGPAIRELYVEDGEVVVKTSDAVSIAFVSNHRLTHVKRGENVNEARFSLEWFLENSKRPESEGITWFRIDVIDKHGKIARTKAYFADEVAEIE